MTGQRPYPNIQTRKWGSAVIQAILKGHPERPGPGSLAYERGLTEPVYDFLSECWRRDRQTRPRADRLVERMEKLADDYEQKLKRMESGVID